MENRVGMGFSCFALGAAIGACVAALYTPHNGRKMRRIVRRRAEDAHSHALDAGRQIADQGRDLYDRGAKMYDRGMKYAMTSR